MNDTTEVDPAANGELDRVEKPFRDNGLGHSLMAALAPTYQLKELLGTGGFGSVFRALHTATGQEVAVKVLRPQVHWSPATAAAQVTRFEREADLCARLHHPNIVRLLSRGQARRGFYYAVYEYVPGETLRATLRREGSLSIERAAELMGQILDALRTAHGKGVIHRDLKPDNIMVLHRGSSSHAKVLDFGIGTLAIEARDTGFNELTRSHEMLGTALYSAPEQLRGDPPTYKSDHYALGLTILECITGQYVIAGKTLAEIYHQHLNPHEHTLPASIARHSLGQFLRKLLLKDANKRSGDTEKLYAEFQRLHLGDLVGGLKGDNIVQRTSGSPPIHLRQVTVIALRLQLQPTAESFLEADVLDKLLDDQINLCRGALARYGGIVAGHLGDQLVAMFGYPSARDTDARLAVRTVLDLAREIRKRSEQKTSIDGCRIQFQIGMHTGSALVKSNQAPTGVTIATALALVANAEANTILASNTSARLIEPFAELRPGDTISVPGTISPLQTSALIGERRDEALTLKPDQTIRAAFVGRANELSRLRQHTEACHDGTSKIVLISGEAGIGKSRLLWEFLRRMQKRGRCIHECRCLAEQENTALSPVLTFIRQRLGLHRLDHIQAGQALIELANYHNLETERLVPVLCMWLSIPHPSDYPPVVLAPHRQRQLLLDALVTIISNLSSEITPLLVFEDLHWADPTTLELIGRLLAKDSTPPLLVFCTARPEFTIPWPESTLDHLRLQQLPEDESRRFVHQLWPHNELDPDSLSTLIERTDGIPLFIEETVHMLREQEEHSQKVDINSIPSTLHALLASRLDRLGDIRIVAQMAAVLGREFDLSLLYAVAGIRGDAIDSAIEELVSADLLYRRRRIGVSTYAFRHILIQSIAYDSMPTEARQQVHERTAELLEQQLSTPTQMFSASLPQQHEETSLEHQTAERFEIVARHWTEAHRADKAIQNWRRACERAEMEAAYIEAIAHTDEALQLISALETSAQLRTELEVQIMRRRLLLWSQGFTAAEYINSGKRIQALSEHLGSETGDYNTFREIYLTTLLSGEFKAADAAAGELKRIAAATTAERGIKMMAEVADAGLRFNLGEFKKGLDCAMTIISQGRTHPLAKHETDGRQALIGAYSYAFVAASLLDMHDLASNLQAEALAMAESPSGNRFEVVIILMSIAYIFIWQLNVEALMPLVDRLLQVCTEPGYALFAGEAYIYCGWATTITGESERGLKMMRSGIEIRQHMKQRVNVEFNLSRLAHAQLMVGELDKAKYTIEDALSIRGEQQWQRAEAIRIQGRCAQALGDRSAALGAYRQAIEIADKFDARLILRMAKEDLQRNTYL